MARAFSGNKGVVVETERMHRSLGNVLVTLMFIIIQPGSTGGFCHDGVIK